VEHFQHALQLAFGDQRHAKVAHERLAHQQAGPARLRCGLSEIGYTYGLAFECGPAGMALAQALKDSFEAA
jgi:hypothetical protein